MEEKKVEVVITNSNISQLYERVRPVGGTMPPCYSGFEIKCLYQLRKVSASFFYCSVNFFVYLYLHKT